MCASAWAWAQPLTHPRPCNHRYYSTQILSLAGFDDKQEALKYGAVVAAGNVVGTIAGLALIDRLGRRTLALCSLAGCFASLLMLSRAFRDATPDRAPRILRARRLHSELQSRNGAGAMGSAVRGLPLSRAQPRHGRGDRGEVVIKLYRCADLPQPGRWRGQGAHVRPLRWLHSCCVRIRAVHRLRDQGALHGRGCHRTARSRAVIASLTASTPAVDLPDRSEHAVLPCRECAVILLYNVSGASSELYDKPPGLAATGNVMRARGMAPALICQQRRPPWQKRHPSL